MKITNIHVESYRIPPSVPWEDATNKVDAIEFIVCHVETDGKIMGTGFTYSVDIGGTSIKTLIEDYYTPLLINQNCHEYEKINTLLSRQSRRLGRGINTLAQSAIDIAVWDILAKTYHVPLYKLLGGSRNKIEVYISEISLFPIEQLSEFLDRLKEYQSDGYKGIKIKIGRNDIEEDCEILQKMRETIGNDMEIYVDLNQKWSEYDFRKNINRLEKYNLSWIEEPLIYTDVLGHKNMKSISTVPIALGESLFTKEQFVEYLLNSAMDIVQADVCFIGGITEWLKVAHVSEAFSKLMAPHYMPELSMQLLCGVRNSYKLENVVGGTFYELGIVEEKMNIQNGFAYPSEELGHGIKFNIERLQSFKTEQSLLRKTFKGGSK